MSVISTHFNPFHFVLKSFRMIIYLIIWINCWYNVVKKLQFLPLPMLKQNLKKNKISQDLIIEIFWWKYRKKVKCIVLKGLVLFNRIYINLNLPVASVTFNKHASKNFSSFDPLTRYNEHLKISLRSHAWLYPNNL